MSLEAATWRAQSGIKLACNNTRLQPPRGSEALAAFNPSSNHNRAGCSFIMYNVGNHLSQADMYYEPPSARSPGSHRHQQQTLHRQSSRQFDAYGQMPSGLYTADDHAAGYEPNRYDRINATMQASNYGYDMPSTHTWNAGGFGGANTLGAMGATGRMKASARGRSALPSVRLDDTVTRYSPT